MASPDKVKFIISHNGDISVGIAGEQAEVLLDASGFNPEDRADFIANAREALTKAFGSIWEFNPSVRTEAELQAAAPFYGGAPWEKGEKVRFGRNNETEIEAFAGLFRYSGLGTGVYYGMTHKLHTDTVVARNLAQQEGVELLYWDSEKASNPDYERMLNTRATLDNMQRFDSATASSSDLNSVGGKPAEAEGQPFTVIGHNEYDRRLFVEHVVAADGLNAFAAAAARQPEAEFSVAIKGTLTEAGNEITLPGEGLVPSGVVLTDHEVFGKVSTGNDPANEPG